MDNLLNVVYKCLPLGLEMLSEKHSPCVWRTPYDCTCTTYGKKESDTLILYNSCIHQWFFYVYSSSIVWLLKLLALRLHAWKFRRGTTIKTWVVFLYNCIILLFQTCSVKIFKEFFKFNHLSGLTLKLIVLQYL